MKFNDRSMALLGIPDLPPRAFIRKAGGGIIPQGGGGSVPTSTTQTNTGLPAWALPYAQDTLAKQSALSERGYQPYGEDRIAGFSPLQEQARTQAAGMQTNQGVGQGMGIAGQVAQGGLNTQNFGQAQADQYMSPYMQNVVDIQKREAQRQSGIQGTQQQAQAAQAGAFGGSRDAIMRAERERNLGTQMGDIQAQGSQAAYTNAQQQFNTDQARGLQGMQLAGNAANTLGQLGGQQFQQGMDINKLQSAYGTQEQGLRQAGLSQAYQDFQNQQAFPQQQLGYMANMINGLPIGTESSVYRTGTSGSPSDLQTLGALGSTAYGLSKFFAGGGLAEQKSVTSEDNIAAIVHDLTDQELAKAKQAAEASGDKVKLDVIAKEEGARASMHRGLGSLPVNMAKMLPTTLSAARGGIVAFAGTEEDGSLVEDDDGGGGNDNPMQLAQLGGAGNRAIYDKSLQRMMDLAEGTAKSKLPEFTPKDAAEARKASRALQMEGVTIDPYKDYGKSVEEMDASRGKNLEQAKGLAALRAGAAMLQGNNAVRGLASGASAFGESYGAALQADQQQKQSIATMRFHMAEAQRKEQMGMNKEARADAALAQKARFDAFNAGVNRDKALSGQFGGIARAARPQAVRGGGAGSNNADKNYFSALKAVDNVSRIISNEKKDQTYIQMQQDASLTPDTPAKKNRVEKAQKYITETDARHKAMQDRAEGVLNRYTPGGNAPAAAPAVATKTPDIASVAGAPKGSKIGKMVTGKGHEVIDASGKLIGYAQ
jgi:hypothetical protein